MRLQHWITEIISIKGVITGLVVAGLLWLFKRLRSKKKEIKWISPKVIEPLTKPLVWITTVVSILLFLTYIFWFHNVFFPPKKLVVALTNFHLVSGAEREDNNALISHLQDSLRVYKDDIELKDSVYPEVRDSTEAREMGKKIKAHIVIWGSIEKTSAEAEIRPNITIIRPMPKMKLRAIQPEPFTKISLAELNQIPFKKQKARQITDVVLFILGLAKHNIGEHEGSIETLEKIKYKNAFVFLYIGKNYRLLPKPDFSGAENAYQMAVQVDSNCYHAYNNWGAVLLYLGRNEDAIEKFKEATRINPHFAEAYCNWGANLVSLGKKKEAIGKFERATQINPNLAVAYYNWGVVLNYLERYEEAIPKHERAIAIDPACFECYGNWGVALNGLKLYKEALSKFERATTINPHYPLAYYNWGISLAKLADLRGDTSLYFESCEKYALAVKYKTDFHKAYSNWGVNLAKLHRYAEAIEKFREAIRLEPREALTWHNLGSALTESEKYNEAIESFHEALKIDPNRAETYLHLAFALAKLNRKKEAKEELLTALDLFKKQGRDEDVKKVEELLKPLEEE